MEKKHNYSIEVKWTGNNGSGTSGYKEYDRKHLIKGNGKTIEGSSDPSFMGDSNKFNPEELLVASLASCHMLWFLHLCSDNGIIVTHYNDRAKGSMLEAANGGGKFSEITLYPKVSVSEEWMKLRVDELHSKAHSLCFIANSVNFPVRFNAECVVSIAEKNSNP